MRFAAVLLSLTSILTPLVSAMPVTNGTNGHSSDKSLEDLHIQSPDGSIKATFIRVGAVVTNFYVKDKDGEFRDIVLGHDDRSKYLESPPAYFGAIVGRYANRIGNSSFELPGTKQVIKVSPNDNDGADTLHGGYVGYDRLPWTVVEHTSNQLKFTLTDEAGREGFPGTVKVEVTYTLKNDGIWDTTMRATPDSLTPIMLSSHTFWNFNGYQNGDDLSDHYIQLQADRYVATDGILIPNGKLPSVEGTALDLRTPTRVDKAIAKTAGTDLCGTGCTGIDNCFIYDNEAEGKTKMIVWSTASGIKLDVTTDQIAAQVYTGNGLQANGNTVRKDSQGGKSGAIYKNHSCVVLEQQSYIDAINQPEWKVNQFYAPGETYKWDAQYKFSIHKD